MLVDGAHADLHEGVDHVGVARHDFLEVGLRRLFSRGGGEQPAGEGRPGILPQASHSRNRNRGNKKLSASTETDKTGEWNYYHTRSRTRTLTRLKGGVVGLSVSTALTGACTSHA